MASSQAHPEFEQLVASVEDTYKELVIGRASRIDGGATLWKRFISSVEAYRCSSKTDSRTVTECVNELAVAKVLTEDRTVHGNIAYEPNILPSGKKIDFVSRCEAGHIYIEVKTVHPTTEDNDSAWEDFVRRSDFHPKDVEFIAEKNWMGGAIYGDAFKSRAGFLQYALEFESRLAEAKAEVLGAGILVFCGTGFAWSLDRLEDFVDFYYEGQHREGDHFASMEGHSMKSKGIELKRNIDHFACLFRLNAQADKLKVHFPVRGPSFPSSRIYD